MSVTVISYLYELFTRYFCCETYCETLQKIYAINEGYATIKKSEKQGNTVTYRKGMSFAIPTHKVQDLVLATVCEFESRLRHHLIFLTKTRFQHVLEAGFLRLCCETFCETFFASNRLLSVHGVNTWGCMNG